MTIANSGKPDVKGFFDPRTWSIQYVVSDPRSKECVIIAPVLDYDEKSGSVATNSADAIPADIADRGLKLTAIFDTHPHADHFSAAQYLKKITGAPTAIGEHVIDVQRLWKGIYNFHDLATAGPQWESTVSQQKALNPHVAGMSEADYIALREGRDRTLPMPKLILHALQVNIRGGRLPEPEDNSSRYLKIPLDAFGHASWGCSGAAPM